LVSYGVIQLLALLAGGAAIGLAAQTLSISITIIR
jgi:hypothetical protein